MKTIKENTNKEIIVNKSKFITYLFKINKEEEIIIILEQLKNKYKDATHHCYAYILNNKKGFFDDKEPSGTAGIPILNILEKKQLTNVLAVVIRYFGGTKLGANGLIRAYQNSVIQCLKQTKIINITTGFEIEINFKYENTKNIDYILNKYEIINKTYKEVINYTFLIKQEDYYKIEKQLQYYCLKVTKIKDILIEN